MQLIINNKVYTDNSKEADENSVFVVSKQNENFKENAIANGCKEIIDSSELKNHIDFSSIKIIGITGTNGKTTTAAAIYSILLDLGYKVALQGTRGFFINDERVEEYSLTTPVQIGNFAHIQKALQNDCDFFDFVTKLIDNDFNTTAYTYLDGFNEYFSYDQEIEKLYKKLEEKKLATNNK